MNFLGLDEILVIALVSLVILGPVKTFGIAVYAGKMFGKAKSYVQKIAKELDLEEGRENVLQIKKGFKDALKDPLVSKVPEPTSKRMWTVDTNNLNQASADDSRTDTSDDLLKRIKALEDEVEKLKKQVM